MSQKNVLLCLKIWLLLCELVPLDSHPRAWSFLQTDSHWTARSGEEQAFHPVSRCHSGTNPRADHQVIFLSSGEPLHSVPKSRIHLVWYMFMYTWSGGEFQKNLSSCVGSWPGHMLAKFLKICKVFLVIFGGGSFGFGNYNIPAWFFLWGWGFYFKYEQNYSNVLTLIVVRESNMSVWRVPLQTLVTMMSTTAPRWPVLGRDTPLPPLAVPVAWPTPVRRATCVTAMLKVELSSGGSGNPLFTFI